MSNWPDDRTGSQGYNYSLRESVQQLEHLPDTVTRRTARIIRKNLWVRFIKTTT